MSFIATINDRFAKLFASNQSGSSITAPAPTTTGPSGDGIFDVRAGNHPFNAIALAFFGTRTSADNETFTARITGWRRISTLWVPVPLLALSLTQGTSVGVAGSDVVATEYFADTITASTAFTSAFEIVSPADNTVGLVKVDVFGCELLQVQLARSTNAACNALVAGF